MITLPFELKLCANECGRECGTELSRCPMFKELTEPLKTQCQQNLHLLQYVYALKNVGIGIPQLYPKPDRSMKGLKNVNLLYPLADNIFIHILENKEDIRDHYIPVEPNLMDDMDDALQAIEDHLSEFVDELENIDDSSKRVDAVMKIIDRLVVVNKNGHKPVKKPVKNVKNNGNGEEKNNSLFLKRNEKSKISLTPFQHSSLKYLLRRKLEGLGVLQPLVNDHNIEDISCSGIGRVFVEHKVFGGLTTTIAFNDHIELDKFVIQLAERIKRPVTFRDPCVDSTLPDGSRINIVYGTDVSKRGSNFTIRKFSPVPMSIIELLQQGTLDHMMAGYLSLMIQEHMNFWVSGETASGKTTLLNALCTFVPPENKIVSIEDTPEIQVPHPNWIRGVTRGAAKNSESAQVSMFDLLKAALRQRPNLIIVGEVRGEEGAIAFQAMQTGHACASTFHAASVTKLIQRLTGNPINVPKSYLDNLNIVIITQMVKLPSGRYGRRITSINEIVAYDSVADAFSYIEVFTWDPITDKFEFKGFMNSYLLEYKIAPRRGIPYQKRREIYNQIKQRAEILKRLDQQKITNFYELHLMLTKAYREGHFR